MVKSFCIFALLLLVIHQPAALAQTASVTGTVTDTTGAVIPGANVSAQNKTTNASRSTITDGSGTYRITNLSPGLYAVVIEKQGFKAMGYSSLELTVDQVQNLNATLAPSSVAEKITVTGSVAPVNLNDPQVAQAVTSQQIQDLPLILRDPYQLILLSPGAIQSNSLLSGISVNGSRERNNNFLMNGTDNNDAEIPGLTLPQPGLTSLNPDSVQEFRVITSNFLPEFGRNTGAVVDIITKRGSNDFHSDVYWFGRYDALGARDYFNHQLDSAGKVVPKDSYVRNTFGGSAGGPLVRDKTFWFVNYEGERFVTTLTDNSTVPTPQFKSGTFTFNGQPIDVSAASLANCPNDNNISCLPLDPTIQSILSLYPSPNGPKVDDVRSLLYFPSKSSTTGDNVTARVDHNLTSKETLAGSYTFNRFEDPSFTHAKFLPGLGGTGTNQRRQNASVQLTSAVSERLINELRVGGNRINFPLTCQGVKTFDSFGPADPFGRTFDFPLPGLSGFGCLLLVDRDGAKRFSGTYTVADNVTWVRGRHTAKWGVEARDVYSNSTNNFLSRTTLDFNNFSNFAAPAFATGNPAVDSQPTLQNMVWSLFGVVGSETQAQFFSKNGIRTAEDPRDFRQQEFNAFIQDSYKVAPSLTVSYGLRYQFNGVPYETHNLLSTLFTDPSRQAPFTFAIAGKKDQGLPPLYSNDWHDFEPRIGLSWDPFHQGKTSVRAGYGIFHDRIFGQLLGLTRGNPPFQQIFFEPFFTPTSIGPPVSTLLSPPPSLTASPTVPNFGFNSSGMLQGGILPFLIDPSLRMPYSQNWNFGIQHELRGNLLVEVNYVGSRGSRLLRVVDGNPPQPALVNQLLAFCVPTNPSNSGFHTQSGQCDQTTLQFDNLWIGAESGILPFDAVNNNAFLHAEVFDNAASSIYHALQANVTKRMSGGLAFQAAYTWSHAIDNSSDPLVPTLGTQEFPRNSLDLAAERGNSDFDVRQRLVISYTWDLPVGPGHQHLAEGLTGKVLGGWKLAGITTFSGGLPYDIFTATDTAHTGQPQRPDYNPAATPVAVSNPHTQTGPNLGLFSGAVFGRAGDLGRNHFYGPGMNNWDMVLQKSMSITERVGLEFRTEIYNLFNRVQFCQPDNSTSDTNTFGHSTCEVRRADQTSGARQIQVGMRLRF
jgi:hypothetical protein